MSDTLLAVNVGNTNTAWGLFRGNKIEARHRTPTDARRVPRDLASDARAILAGAVGEGASTAMAVASVVPAMEGHLEALGRELLGVAPLFVSGANAGMPVLVEAPAQVGADRIANAVAAHARCGGPCIVVDFGTATTFDVVSAAGEFLGGAIAPGLGMAADALAERTAKLPRVSLERPPGVIGRSTVECLQVGLLWGFVALTEGLLSRMAAALPARPIVIATGGLAALVAPEVPLIESVDPDLTLDGIRLIHDRWRSGMAV